MKKTDFIHSTINLRTDATRSSLDIFGEKNQMCIFSQLFIEWQIWMMQLKYPLKFRGDVPKACENVDF